MEPDVLNALEQLTSRHKELLAAGPNLSNLLNEIVTSQEEILEAVQAQSGIFLGILVAVIAVAGSLVGVLYSQWAQNNRERNAAIREQKISENNRKISKLEEAHSFANELATGAESTKTEMVRQTMKIEYIRTEFQGELQNQKMFEIIDRFPKSDWIGDQKKLSMLCFFDGNICQKEIKQIEVALDDFRKVYNEFNSKHFGTAPSPSKKFTEMTDGKILALLLAVEGFQAEISARIQELNSQTF